MEPPNITLIKGKNDIKLDKYFVKNKLSRDHSSEKSDLYEFKMTLFDNGEPEKFFLFLQNFQMTLEASGKFTAGANIQYLCTIVHSEVIYQLDTLSVEVGITTTEQLNLIFLILGAYFFLVMRCQSKSA